MAVVEVLADLAAEVAMELFQSPRLAVERKHDDSPVTAADREIEQRWRETIRARFPHDAILGEERGEEPGSSGWRWVLDPIDGTISFAAGVPLFGSLVGLEFEGVGVGGLCGMPALGERVWAAAGGGAWWERRQSRGGRIRERARVAEGSNLATALICVSGLEYFKEVGELSVLERVVARARCVRGWSDCYGGMLVATGRVDGWVDSKMNPWDLAPFPIIIQEAGGRCSDWRGGVRADGGNAIAGSKALHAELLELVSEGKGIGHVPM